MKACCPFHDENTPSFIFNPKTLNFHCFGCGKNVDLIDAYMHKGDTYIGAVQKVFEHANVPYAFGEVGLKTKRDYRYPNEEADDLTEVLDYLSIRGISAETAVMHGVGADSRGNIAFHYYDTNNVLTMVKYRPSHRIDKAAGEIKSWCQKDADTTPLLFNMNRVNIDAPLLVAEGEGDCLAAIEAGYTNAVSVPFGAGNFSWIEENFEWLEQFDSIIICSDNDEPGIKMQKECVSRLGSWRTKVVEIPQTYTDENGKVRHIKDLNEVLFYMGKQEVLNLILNAKDSPVDSVKDLSDIKSRSLDDLDGVCSGLATLDKEIMRFFYGTLTVLSGLPASGKTSFMYQLICQALDQGKNCWLFSGELPEEMTKDWFNYILAGRRNIKAYETREGDTYYRVTPDAMKEIDDHYRGRWFVYKDDCENDLELLLQSMTDVARKYGAKFFVLDNMMTIDVNNSDEELREQKEVVKKLVAFSKKFNVAIVLVCHPRKMQNTSTVGMYDIAGTSNIVNLAHRTIGLKLITEQEKNGNAQYSSVPEHLRNYDVCLNIIKDRMRGRQGKYIGLYYDVPSRRFFSNKKEYEHNYAWDTKTYEDHLPYDRPDDEEVFGKGGKKP